MELGWAGQGSTHPNISFQFHAVISPAAGLASLLTAGMETEEPPLVTWCCPGEELGPGSGEAECLLWCAGVGGPLVVTAPCES